MSYYRNQLDKVHTRKTYPALFKIQSDEGSTKWMNLNEDSVKDLREWLDENFPPVMMKLEDVQDKKSF